MSEKNILNEFADFLAKSAMMTGDPSEHSSTPIVAGSTAPRVNATGSLNMMPANYTAQAAPKPGTDTSQGLKKLKV